MNIQKTNNTSGFVVLEALRCYDIKRFPFRVITNAAMRNIAMEITIAKLWKSLEFMEKGVAFV